MYEIIMLWYDNNRIVGDNMKKESANKLGTNILFGRARRIEFVEKAAYVVIAIISPVITISLSNSFLTI